MSFYGTFFRAAAMRICVYGAGAVGLGLASCLIKAGADVDIIARLTTVDALKNSGLFRTGIFGDFHAAPDQFASYCSLADDAQTGYDFVMVCTKSFDSAAAAKDLAAHNRLLDSDVKIVHFQNGWGNAEKFLDFFKPHQIYSARVITGFTRPKPNEVRITVHADAIHIGSLFSCDPSEVKTLCELITGGGIECEPTQSIDKDLWAKMLYNCLLNPIGAILGVSYGTLAQVDCTKKLMNTLAAEVFDVMTAAGYSTHWPGVDDFLRAFYGRLVPDTAEHKSSMLQDLTAGKKTEIDALNGAVLALADKHRLAAPYNKAVYELVKFMEVNT
jgi:2-dehydropantoate 2-reductase